MREGEESRELERTTKKQTKKTIQTKTSESKERKGINHNNIILYIIYHAEETESSHIIPLRRVSSESDKERGKQNKLGNNI